MVACSPARSMTFSPTGMTAASTSRVKVVGPSLCIYHLRNLTRCSSFARETLKRPRPGSSRLLIFRGDGLVLAFEGGHEGVPGEDGAFDAGGKLVHAGEHGEFAHIAVGFAGHDHLMDAVEQLFHLGLGFALHAFGEQRGRSLGDAAAGPDEADVLD